MSRGQYVGSCLGGKKEWKREVRSRALLPGPTGAPQGAPQGTAVTPVHLWVSYVVLQSDFFPASQMVLGVQAAQCVPKSKRQCFCKVSLNKWKLQGSPEMEDRRFTAWKAVKDFHGNSTKVVNSISVHSHVSCSFSFFFFSFIFSVYSAFLCFKGHCHLPSGRWPVHSIAFNTLVGSPKAEEIYLWVWWTSTLHLPFAFRSTWLLCHNKIPNASNADDQLCAAYKVGWEEEGSAAAGTLQASGCVLTCGIWLPSLWHSV